MSAKATAKASSAATVTLKHLASKLAEDHAGVRRRHTVADLDNRNAGERANARHRYPRVSAAVRNAPR